MSLFSKNKQPPASSGRVNVFDIDYPFDRSSWVEVFSACAGRSFVVQQRFAELIVKDRDWFVDFNEQTLSFGEDAFPVQFIGSESRLSNTWMWGWNNINDFDPQILGLAEQVRILGQQWQLQPLTAVQFDIDDTFNVHTLAMVATGIGGGGNMCYYIGPHENGSAVMAVPIKDGRVFEPVGLGDFVSILMSAIKQFDLDHKIFAESFLLWNGIPFERDGKTLIAYFPQQKLKLTLENAGGMNRITNIKTI
ncbi:MAG: hypothetical protein J5956_04895 [Ruminococcus sp.]|nr:hypothetical protein [Ruminococcus sp.]